MTNAIELHNVSFAYQNEASTHNSLEKIDLTIPSGQFVVLCGESGCGKTTLTRLINGLIPHYYEGKMSGTVSICGKNVSEQPLYDTASLVGSVFQNPRSQFFNVDTTGEITFGCENLGMPPETIEQRLDKVNKAFHLEWLLGRNIFHLSGGEKQKIACAGAAMMEPEIFVLDEPSSNLDAAAIEELKETLAYWKSQGKTIVISEHRLYYLRDLADRFIYIKNGKIQRDDNAAVFRKLNAVERSALGLRVLSLDEITFSKDTPASTETLELEDFHFAYKNSKDTLRISRTKIPYKGITAIIGNNGAGKSTFSRCFCGLEKRCGIVTQENTPLKPKERLNQCYMVMQEVNHQLFTESVLDEVLISMAEESPKAAEEILDHFDLLEYKDCHPQALSGGQKQRLAIASAIAADRSILFFDEPTSGLDRNHMIKVAEQMVRLREAEKTIYVITHDPELIAACCTDIIRMESGTIAEQYPLDSEGAEKLKTWWRQISAQ